jgi:hypothetical protein
LNSGHPFCDEEVLRRDDYISAYISWSSVFRFHHRSVMRLKNANKKQVLTFQLASDEMGASEWNAPRIFGPAPFCCFQEP